MTTLLLVDSANVKLAELELKDDAEAPTGIILWKERYFIFDYRLRGVENTCQYSMTEVFDATPLIGH